MYHTNLEFRKDIYCGFSINLNFKLRQNKFEKSEIKKQTHRQVFINEFFFYFQVLKKHLNYLDKMPGTQKNKFLDMKILNN